MGLPNRYPVPASQTRVEMEVKKSRFLATGTRAASVEEAQAWITSIRREFPDARHHCPAFRIGYGHQVAEWSSDDGEPSGTAGKPMLSVLQGHDVGDIVVVVTRYTGGVKLGTGGLVRAYGGVVRELLDAMPIEMLVARTAWLLSVEYRDFERAKEHLLAFEAEIEEERFETDVTFAFSLPVDRVEEARATLTDVSKGRWSLVVSETHHGG